MNNKLSLNDNHFQTMKIYVSNKYAELYDVLQLSNQELKYSGPSVGWEWECSLESKNAV